MESDTPPSIASFVIRFVVDDPPLKEEAQPAYRGIIRHIQSNKEMVFSIWDDAVDFIQRYVPLETKSDQGTT